MAEAATATSLRLWKLELQKLANELGFPIHVCHYAPETSKWNKIKHRLFSFITQNWRGKPLYSHQVIVNLISSTKTSTGLEVRCRLDDTQYAKGIRVSDHELSSVNLYPHDFHGERNYAIHPDEDQEKTDNGYSRSDPKLRELHLFLLGTFVDATPPRLIVQTGSTLL